jgi:eukaryotic-like serine/threonine-protein kinase
VKLPDPMLGQRFGPEDRYEILKSLGTGGYGEVYLADDQKRKRKVALKLLRNEEVDAVAIERFRREAKKYGIALNHENIALVLDSGMDRGRHFIVFEYIEGRTLKQILEADGVFGVDEALRIARGIATGLQAVHRISVVHRDIKPSNVMVTTTDRLVKILDFGVAKDLMSAGVSKSKDFNGTIGYASPEQTSGHVIDHRADIFALGAVLYEIITGEYAFRGRTKRQIAVAVLTQDPIPPTRFNASVTRPVVSLIGKMLKKKPHSRPKSVDEVIEEIDRIRTALAEGPGEPEPGLIRKWLRKLIRGVT